MAIETRALCLGDNCVDYYLPPLNLSLAGGNAVNTSVAMQRAGLSTAYAGFIGDDEDGKFILTSLRQQGVDVSHVRTIPGQTGKTYISLTPQGERRFLFEHLGPVFPLPLEEELLGFALQHRLIHTTVNGGAQAYLPEIKKRNGIQVSMDYGDTYTQEFFDETIAYVDLAFFSLPEGYPGSARDFARQMYRPHLTQVVVTMGKDGSLACNSSYHYQPAISVEVVDSLGAGDSYIGTYLASWLLGKGIPRSMENASQAAAVVCTHLGAWEQIHV